MQEEEEDDDVEEDDVEEKGRSQDREADFVRACAVEMHVDISHTSHFVWKFRGKLAEDTSGDIVLCEPAQSKCMEPFCVEIYRTSTGR